ncbi:restriction endonuclease subunit S [Hymenobacter convexus]|uniref:restriction endonuclease subunit S n=1 Tax=Hymenobacter sp. CA1UV-4 TaxID=3063782 RepID=UPI002713D380|nr:restriction endonuclease subunit S [Hymenobacter sp. CA1UV-4]MDO7850401.1 restriction endonuclease subunit S [Hymenobacter sp. CA1UV-4]
MKQTVIGEIPADWEVVKLGDIISDLKSGVSVNSEDKRIQIPGEIGILKTSAVANGHFLPNQHKLVIEKDVQRAKLNPAKGSILVSRMNTPALVGDSCYVDKDYPDLFIPDRLWMTVFNPKKKISSRWLSFVLVSDSFKETIKSTATGTSNSMKNISKGSFLSLEVLLPPLPQQRKIAEILSTVDEKMAVIDEQLAQTQELKKGLMQRLLTKGIGHTAFKDSPLGKIPESWEVASLGSVFDFLNGKAFKPSEWSKTGLPIIRIQNLNGSSVFNFYDGPVDNRNLVEPNQLLFSWSGSRGTSFGPFRWNGKIGVLNQHIFKILVKNVSVLDSDFGFYFLKYLTSDIEDRAHGASGLVHITKKELEHFNLSLPPLFEQRKIAEALNTVDDKLQVLTDKKAQYQELKRGLMQQLLTGQRRVRVAQPEEALT